MPTVEVISKHLCPWVHMRNLIWPLKYIVTKGYVLQSTVPDSELSFTSTQTSHGTCHFQSLLILYMDNYNVANQLSSTSAALLHLVSCTRDRAPVNEAVCIHCKFSTSQAVSDLQEDVKESVSVVTSGTLLTRSAQGDLRTYHGHPTNLTALYFYDTVRSEGGFLSQRIV